MTRDEQYTDFELEIASKLGAIDSRLSSIEKCISSQGEKLESEFDDYSLKIRSLEDDRLTLKIAASGIAFFISAFINGLFFIFRDFK